MAVFFLMVFLAGAAAVLILKSLVASAERAEKARIAREEREKTLHQDLEPKTTRKRRKS